MQLVRRIAALSVMTAAAASALTGCVSDAQSRSQLDLVATFVDRPDDPDWPYLDAVDVTSSVCVENVSCRQAVRSDYVMILTFPDSDDARDYAGALGGDGVQIDPLVIDFIDESLTSEERLEIIQSVAGINASSPD